MPQPGWPDLSGHGCGPGTAEPGWREELWLSCIETASRHGGGGTIRSPYTANRFPHPVSLQTELCQVDVELPAYATFTDRVTATVRANYALGRPVRGTATVAVYPRYKSGYLQPIFSEPLRQV